MKISKKKNVGEVEDSPVDKAWKRKNSGEAA